MVFFDYPDVVSVVRKSEGVPKSCGVDEIFKLLFDSIGRNGRVLRGFEALHGLVVVNNQWVMERDWVSIGKPYYNVYNGIIGYLIRLRGDKVDSSFIELPLKVICFRLPVDCEFFKFDWNGGKFCLRNILAGCYVEDIGGVSRKCLTLWMDFGERLDGFWPVMCYRRIPLGGGLLDDCIAELPVDVHSMNQGVRVPDEIMMDAVRLVCSVCLLSSNLEDGLIVPDVLNKDRDKFAVGGDVGLVERAKRRGKFGWSVGESFSVVPHWRGPSPLALYWTGKGRLIPRYRLRRGTIVHRKLVELSGGQERR